MARELLSSLHWYDETRSQMSRRIATKRNVSQPHIPFDMAECGASRRFLPSSSAGSSAGSKARLPFVATCNVLGAVGSGVVEATAVLESASTLTILGRNWLLAPHLGVSHLVAIAAFDARVWQDNISAWRVSWKMILTVSGLGAFLAGVANLVTVAALRRGSAILRHVPNLAAVVTRAGVLGTIASEMTHLLALLAKNGRRIARLWALLGDVASLATVLAGEFVNTRSRACNVSAINLRASCLL
jgi:hypothetical protein